MINELVKKLSEGVHEVAIGSCNESGEEIKQRTEGGFIHIKFTQTRGGTELGININNTNLDKVDFLNETGVLHIEGSTNLNYCNVRCIVDIDLSTKKGTGYLQFRDSALI